ncbi:MAG TPA: hypothetical protein VM261_31965 [Kofleriaceae bacterium]|nr:hypothetical protein [Kofleriaceae bacterium]
MTARPGVVSKGAIATLAGLALAGAHALIVPALVDATGRPGLEVRWPGPLVAETASAGSPSAAATESHDGGAPGLVWNKWTVRYRGGIERSVGAVQLVGPFQDPAAPPCSGRLVVGQRLVDDGRGGAGAGPGPGTIAAIIASELARELKGQSFVGVGSFVRVDDVHAAWATFTGHPIDVALFPEAAFRAPAPTGYFRATAIVVFDRVRVPVVIGAVPRIDHGSGTSSGKASLGFTVGVRAKLDFDNRTLDWLNSRVGGDRMLTKAVSAQLDTALLAALGAPPPLALPGGRTLVVELCPDRAVDVVDGRYAAVPLRWKLGGAVADPAGGPAIRPPLRGPVAFTEPSPDAGLTLDLDVDALDGLLFELWRTGWLDEQLDQVRAHERFNTNETVATYLTLQVSPLRLRLPPTLRPIAGGGLALDVALRVDISDGRLLTPGHAWTTLALGLREGAAFIEADVGVTALELACEPSPGIMRPCYGDVVSVIRDAAPTAHAQLAGALTSALTGVFAPRRLEADGSPAAIELSGARARIIATGARGDERFVRVSMDGTISPRPTPARP